MAELSPCPNCKRRGCAAAGGACYAIIDCKDRQLAAAAAMVEDARKLAGWVVNNRAGDSDLCDAARRILASRPSEQASGVEMHGTAPPAVQRVMADAYANLNTSPWRMGDAEQASKEDSDRIRSETADEDPGACSSESRRTSVAPAGSATGRIQELETQLAEARASTNSIHAAYDTASREREELRAKLEAAEAERAHLLEAAELLRMFEADDHEWSAPEQAWLKRDQSRAPAATGEPKPQPHPQPERLGGPADALRLRLAEFAREAGASLWPWARFAELLEQER